MVGYRNTYPVDLTRVISLSGVPMVGYRNDDDFLARCPNSLSGVPMVGYRNATGLGNRPAASLSGVPMVGYRNWMQNFGNGNREFIKRLRMETITAARAHFSEQRAAV